MKMPNVGARGILAPAFVDFNVQNYYNLPIKPKFLHCFFKRLIMDSSLNQDHNQEWEHFSGQQLLIWEVALWIQRVRPIVV